jgi:hypothetical protein
MASATVNGKITVSENTPRLITLWELYTYEFQGTTKEGKRKWSLWFITDHHGLKTGDWIEAKGQLSTKAVEWTTPEGNVKNLVDHILNEPTLLVHKTEEAKPTERVRDLDDEAKYGGLPF